MIQPVPVWYQTIYINPIQIAIFTNKDVTLIIISDFQSIEYGWVDCVDGDHLANMNKI